MSKNMKETISRICSEAKVALLGGALLVAGSTVAFTHIANAKDAPKNPPVRLSVDDAPVKPNGGYQTTFAPVVKKVAPGVVKISVSSKGGGGEAMELSDQDQLLRRFFGEAPGMQQRRQRAPKQEGLGSGVIVSKDGYILTNNHVVDHADQIKVELNDGREFTGKVVGTDAKSDVAVVKIDATDLPFVQLANSDKIEVGDLVLAVGNPFGIGQTVTMGMVSATGRAHMGLDYEDFIQTDAAINPGNSGGALVDAEGRLVGINTAIISRSGGNQGIGFAVPVNLARYVMESIVQNGRVVRGYVGLGIQPLNAALAEQFKIKGGKGALVGEVRAKGPGEKAGVKSGDVIVEFNGKPVNDSQHFRLEVAMVPPGTKVPMKVLRDGEKKTLEVAIQEMPGDLKVADNKKVEARKEDALDGVEVADIESARGQIKIPREIKGALVTQVDPDSAAYEAGIRQGDVIQEINRKAVKNAEDAVTMTENIKEKKILLKVWSNGNTHFIVVDESKVG